LLRLLGPGLARVVSLTTGVTAAEVISKVEELKPAVVCLGNIPPLSHARARYLCKRLRMRHPQLPIVAGSWGGAVEDAPPAELVAAGASRVGLTLAETRQILVPLLQLAPHLEAAREQIEPGGRGADRGVG
jgi:hypothetical protein